MTNEEKQGMLYWFLCLKQDEIIDLHNLACGMSNSLGNKICEQLELNFSWLAEEDDTIECENECECEVS